MENYNRGGFIMKTDEDLHLFLESVKIVDDDPKSQSGSYVLVSFRFYLGPTPPTKQQDTPVFTEKLPVLSERNDLNEYVRIASNKLATRLHQVADNIKPDLPK